MAIDKLSFERYVLLVQDRIVLHCTFKYILVMVYFILGKQLMMLG